MQVHKAAVDALCDWLDVAAVALFSSGYAANVGTLSALLDKDCLVLSDALNHASIIDGCRLSGATIKVYRHLDVAHARALLTENSRSYARTLIVTESMFSMDGDRAPLSALRRLADEHHAALYVDEAHALGVYGAEGRGLCAANRVRPDILVGTLGKALGLQGAFVAGAQSIVDWLYHRARSLVYSTGMSPALAAVIPLAVQLTRHAERERALLEEHRQRLHHALVELGLLSSACDGIIMPVILGDAKAAMQMAQRLWSQGVWVHAIRPPTVPEGASRLRCVLSAAHHQEHISRAMDAFRRSMLP